MSSEQRADRPTLVSPSELRTTGQVLPKGVVALNAVRLSYPTAQGGATDSPANCVLGPCVFVIYAQDDYTIHKAEVCGSSTSYKICGDSVVSHW